MPTRQSDPERTERLRGRKAVAQRQRRLRAEPLCRKCKELGRIIAASVPDHVIPLHKGGTDDDSNIQCLCTPCHDLKTAHDMGYKYKTKQTVDPDGWPLN